MAGETRKKKTRRSYLDDFRLDAAGNYAYMGKHYRFFSADGRSRKQALTVPTLYALGLSLSSILSGLLPARGTTGIGAESSAFVMLPLMAELIALVTLDYAFIRLMLQAEPLRAYVHEKTVLRLPRRAVILAVFSGLGLVSEGIFLILQGFGEKLVPTLLYLISKAATLILSLLFWRSFSRLRWQVDEVS